MKVALRTDPALLEATRPMTALAKSACELVLQATAGKSSAIRLVLSILKEGQNDIPNETETEFDPTWEWSTGLWQPFETKPVEPKASKRAADGRHGLPSKASQEEAQKVMEENYRETERLREDFVARLRRAAEAHEEEEQRRAAEEAARKAGLDPYAGCEVHPRDGPS